MAWRSPSTLAASVSFFFHCFLWLIGSDYNVTGLAAVPNTTSNYEAVDAIFHQHCLDCHAAQDPEHGLVLETFDSLLKGGESGPAILPGNSPDSLLVRMIEGRFEKNGKSKVMPPGKRKRVSQDEIATIKAWIDSGAKAPTAPLVVKELTVPKITPRTNPRQPITSLAYSRKGKLLAVARYAEVELRASDDLRLIRRLAGQKGCVNAVVFSLDGNELFAAGGQAALSGEARQWNLKSEESIRVFGGHKDAIYALALSPDASTLATGSYDQKIKLWNVASGREMKTLSGHNGCVYQLAFRPDGKILASASADRTVKLWDVSSGERRETLSQSFKEVYALAFSPDGSRLLAGGADNRIRIWQISETAAETTNPLLQSKFAHEGAILRLAFSEDGKRLISAADDRSVKLWEPMEMKELLLLEKQSDWSPALAFGDDYRIFAGRLDGTLAAYEGSTGKLAASAGTDAKIAETISNNRKVTSP